ncbi:MAG: FecR domain-containing protein [Thermotogota bacterium]
MIKKWGVLLILLMSFSIVFGLTIEAEKYTALVGDSVKLNITTEKSTITHLYVDLNSGGFDDPLILFDGLNIENGSADLIFLAPLIPGKSEITFYNENRTVEKTIIIDIVEEQIDIAETKLQIVEKKGNVLYRQQETEIWDTLSIDNVIEEDSELMTLKDGFIVLKEPTLDIVINVSSETQLFIKKLRSSENGDIDIEYDLKKGSTVNKINEILAPGSKYIVSSGSVVAGVRGTQFGFEKIGDKTTVRTFEGTVFTSINGRLFPVKENSMLSFNEGKENPEINTIDSTIEDYEGDVEPEETEMPEENQDVKDPETREPATTTQPIQSPSANIGNISFGKQQKGTDSYLVYSFAPQFDFGKFGIGIGFNAYQNAIDSPLYYGIPTPSASPTDDIWSAFSINYLKLDFNSFYARYGISPAYTKGLGLFMNNYYIPDSRVFDTEIRLENIKIGAHIPYELNSVVPFNYSQTSNVFFGYLDVDLSLFNTEITAIMNLNEDKPSNEFSQAYLTTFYRDILFFRLGVEGDIVFTNDGSMTYGALAGPLINFPPYFQFMFGVNYLSDGFNPEYLNPYYENNSAYGNYMDLDTEKSFGLMGKTIFNLDPYLKVSLKYNKLFNETRDGLLNGEMTVNIPSLGSVPPLMAGFNYMQYKFLEDETVDNVFLNENTNLRGYIYYPVLESSGIIYSVNYNMQEQKFVYSLSFETREF